MIDKRRPGKVSRDFCIRGAKYVFIFVANTSAKKLKHSVPKCEAVNLPIARRLTFPFLDIVVLQKTMITRWLFHVMGGNRLLTDVYFHDTSEFYANIRLTIEYTINHLDNLQH